MSAAPQGQFEALIHLELEALLEPFEKNLMYVIFLCLFVYERNYRERLSE